MADATHPPGCLRLARPATPFDRCVFTTTTVSSCASELPIETEIARHMRNELDPDQVVQALIAGELTHGAQLEAPTLPPSIGRKLLDDLGLDSTATFASDGACGP